MSAYGVTNEANYTPENFIAGDYPIVRDYGTIKNGATVRRHAPVVRGASGIEEAAAGTLDKLIGMAAAEPSGNEIVYYATGEFFTEAIVLPDGITMDALKTAFAKINIYIKELKNNG